MERLRGKVLYYCIFISIIIENIFTVIFLSVDIFNLFSLPPIDFSL